MEWERVVTVTIRRENSKYQAWLISRERQYEDCTEHQTDVENYDEFFIGERDSYEQISQLITGFAQALTGCAVQLALFDYTKVEEGKYIQVNQKYVQTDNVFNNFMDR
ncbi:hypothetical protein D3C77_638150 [compost metagenome]